MILTQYKDPHLYTALMKSYLRELPDPLFASAFTEHWKTANAIKDGTQRIKEIKRILNMIPDENKNNIEFLFNFLAQLFREELSNLIAVDNLVMIFGPNLLWNIGTKDNEPVMIENVFKSLLDEWSMISFMSDENRNHYVLTKDPLEMVEDHFEFKEKKNTVKNLPPKRLATFSSLQDNASSSESLSSTPTFMVRSQSLKETSSWRKSFNRKSITKTWRRPTGGERGQEDPARSPSLASKLRETSRESLFSLESLEMQEGRASSLGLGGRRSRGPRTTLRQVVFALI